MNKSKSEVNIVLYCKQSNSRAIHGGEIQVECLRVGTSDILENITNQLLYSDILDEYDLETIEMYIIERKNRIALGLCNE